MGYVTTILSSQVCVFCIIRLRLSVTQWLVQLLLNWDTYVLSFAANRPFRLIFMKCNEEKGGNAKLSLDTLICSIMRYKSNNEELGQLPTMASFSFFAVQYRKLAAGRIWTQIVGVVGESTDHYTTTMSKIKYKSFYKSFYMWT